MVAAALVLLVGACERPQERLDAAEDIRAFLVAAREGDRATFDRHVDRQALKAQLSGQAEEILGGQVPPALRARVLDQLVDGLGPETFQLATQGALGGRTPTAAEIAAVARPLSATRVCLPSQPGAEGCAVTFENQGGTWRLVAVDASGIQAGPGLPAGTEFLERFPGAPER